MKFICTRENLSHALDAVGAIAGKQNNLPILSNILIQVEEASVYLVSTNLELAIKYSLRAKVDEIGSFTVPAKTLFDYVHLLTEEQIEMIKEDNELKITCGHSSTKIKGSPADDYPVLPEVEEKHSYTILTELFRDALSRVVMSAAKNEIRPELSGVFFEFFGENYQGLVLAATDSYRLAEKKTSVVQGKDSAKFIVPAKAVYELIRLLSLVKEAGVESQVRLVFSETQLLLRYNNFELSARLVDGTYPDYSQIIPAKFKTTAVFPVDLVINKIKAAGLFTTTGVNAVSFDFNTSSGTVAVSSTSTQKGEHSSELDVEVSGEENSILLNHRYLLDGLQHMSGEVEFLMNSADAPCLIREKKKDDFLYIVMPIRQ
jgi:DNA polymerase-3 subunit beta